MGKLNDRNVFIFNFIPNNEKNVKLLEKTFREFNCFVRIYESLKKSELLQVVEEISYLKFIPFKYIVFVVLNNTNKSMEVLESSDGCEVLLDAEIIVEILKNQTFLNRKVLFLLQINRNLPCDDDEKNEEVKIEIESKNEKQLEDSKPASSQNRQIKSCTKLFIYATPLNKFLPKNNDLFVETFCECFSKYAENLGMDELHQKFQNALTEKGYESNSTMETFFQVDKSRIFGQALTEDDRNFLFHNST